MSVSDPHSSPAPPTSQGIEPPWDLIADRIDAFSAAWDAALAADAPPPPLGQFLQPIDPLAERYLLIELAKLDIERRFQHDRQPQPVQWYAQQYPRLGPTDGLPVELIYEELQARAVAGQPVYQQEIERR